MQIAAILAFAVALRGRLWGARAAGATGGLGARAVGLGGGLYVALGCRSWGGRTDGAAAALVDAASPIRPGVLDMLMCGTEDARPLLKEAAVWMNTARGDFREYSTSGRDKGLANI